MKIRSILISDQNSSIPFWPSPVLFSRHLIAEVARFGSDRSRSESTVCGDGLRAQSEACDDEYQAA